jgi:hypothetical protein
LQQAVVHRFQPEVIDNVLLLLVSLPGKRVGGAHKVHSLHHLCTRYQYHAHYFQYKEKYEIEKAPYEQNEVTHRCDLENCSICYKNKKGSAICIRTDAQFQITDP